MPLSMIGIREGELLGFYLEILTAFFLGPGDAPLWLLNLSYCPECHTADSCVEV